MTDAPQRHTDKGTHGQIDVAPTDGPTGRLK